MKQRGQNHITVTKILLQRTPVLLLDGVFAADQ